jgi:hypothetical protein
MMDIPLFWATLGVIAIALGPALIDLFAAIWRREP